LGVIFKKEDMKKVKVTKDDALELIINKQLEPYKVDMEFVRENNTIEGKPWYQHFTFKKVEDWQNWKDYSIEVLTTKLSPKMPKKQAEKQFLWIDMMWGLKQEFGWEELQSLIKK
jgi:hypothetical protein